nr:MAG TPA: hypothetical protein [Caudoviricetes sp.]
MRRKLVLPIIYTSSRNGRRRTSVGAAEAAKILERAGAGCGRCHTGSVAGAGVDALGGCLSAVAVGQRICGRTCTYGNDHRGVYGGRVRQALSNHDTILLSVLVCASRDIDGQRVVGKRDRLTDDQVRAEFAACFASHSIFLLKIRGRGVLPLPRWFTRCYRGVCRLAAAAAVHAHVGVCHLISGNRTRIDPVQDGIGLLGHHSGQKRILTILRSGELQALVLSGQSGNLILREVVHHAAEVGVAVVHDGAGVVCDSLTGSAVLLCNGVLQVADELLVLAAARCQLRGKCGLTRLPCVALLHDSKADGVVAVGHAAFQTVHKLCVLVAELTDSVVHACKAVRNVGVDAVHLCQLVIAQRADAALDASQRTGGILLVEALRQRRASICATLTSCASADQIGDVAVHAVVTTVSTIAVCTPAEDDGEDDNRPQTFVSEKSAVVIAAVLPSQIASCKIVHNKTPFSFALCHPTAVCDGRSQTKAVFVKSAKLRSVSLRGMRYSALSSFGFRASQKMMARSISPDLSFPSKIFFSKFFSIFSSGETDFDSSIQTTVIWAASGSGRLPAGSGQCRALWRGSAPSFGAVLRSCPESGSSPA